MAVVFCAACSGSQLDENDASADVPLAGAVGKGEQITDANAPSESLLSAEDNALLAEISQRVHALGLSQEQVNRLTDSLSGIEDTHEFFVALRAALDDPKTLEELSAKAGESQSLAYVAGATYPSSCYNQVVNYQIQIQTDGRENAGTDANVFLRWKMKYRTTTSNYTAPFNLNTPANDFEKGSRFDSFYQQTSFGDIVQFNLYHDNTGNYTQGGPGWFPNWVTFWDSCSRRLYTGPINLWLATQLAPLYSTNFSSDNISMSTL